MSESMSMDGIEKTMDARPRLITCVIATYNAAATLKQALDSLASQTYAPEIIIIDGASHDETMDIVSSYREHIAYVISEHDNGIYDAMNKGIASAHGDYIYFLGADDCLVSKDVLYDVAAKISSYPDGERPDVFYGSVLTVNEKYHLEKQSFTEAQAEKFYHNMHLAHQGMFVKTSLMREHPFDCRYRICADYEFVLWLYFEKKASFQQLNQPIAFYSMSGLSSVDTRNMVEESIRIMKEHNLPDRVIDSYIRLGQVSYPKRQIRMLVRKAFEHIGILKWWYLHHGWQKHHCSNAICRWCHRP